MEESRSSHGGPARPRWVLIVAGVTLLAIVTAAGYLPRDTTRSADTSAATADETGAGAGSGYGTN